MASGTGIRQSATDTASSFGCADGTGWRTLRRAFRPEFLNRLDETVFYKPLTKEDIDGIVALQLADLNRRLAQKQVKIALTDAARAYIVTEAYDPLFGARPLKRYLQAMVETPVARKLIREDVKPGAVLTVDVEDGGLVIR